MVNPKNPAERVTILSAEKVEQFYELTQQAKKIEQELASLKKEFHASLDQMVGENEKGDLIFGDFQLQRQIRTSIQFDQDKTVQRLEDLRLHDCIETVRKPNPEKINAALSLGLLAEEEIQDCQQVKLTPAIVVRKL